MIISPKQARVKITNLLPARFFAFIIALLFCSKMSAQDIHWSQFGNSPLNLSPGQTGVFGGDLRFAANYRNQWRTVPVPYTTFSGSVENKFYHQKGKYDRFFTGSLLLNYDKQGSLNLTSLQIGIPISYTAPVGANNFLTFGVTPMFGQRSFGNTKNLSFDEQWNGCFFDNGTSHTENLLVNNTSLNYFDVSGGINFRTQSATKRSKLDLGAGLHHLNRPNHNFWSDKTGDYKLASKMTFYGLGSLQIARKVDLVGQVLYQKQGTYEEIVSGVGARFHLNMKPYQELALQAGVDFRHRYTDAVIPHVEVHYRTWQLGFSYDINSSNFKQATNNRGGPEVSLIYRLYRVKPLSFKACQII